MTETEVKKRLTNKQAVDPIRRLFEDLNQPSEPRLKQALKARGIPFTNEQVSSIVKGSASRQIFAPRQRYVGKVTSTAPNLRWAADMVFMSSTPNKNGQKFMKGNWKDGNKVSAKYWNPKGEPVNLFDETKTE